MPTRRTPLSENRISKSTSEEIVDGIEHESVITVMAPASAIYNFWHDLRNLPNFMKNLTSIQVQDAKRSHWKWKVLRGHADIEWDSEITRDVPNSLIAWRSLEGSTCVHAGQVTFRELPHNRGTEVRVLLSYHPPGGRLTDFIEKVLGESPQRSTQDDLRRLRELIEVGLIPTTDGQSHGGLEETLNPKLH